MRSIGGSSKIDSEENSMEIEWGGGGRTQVRLNWVEYEGDRLEENSDEIDSENSRVGNSNEFDW